MSDFEKDLASLLNRYSQENGSNTPDFVLARYLTGCLRLFNATVNARSDWYGYRNSPGRLPEGPGVPAIRETD